MAMGSSIEWTEATWNPVTGCTKISPGCKHCYAERMAKRLQAMGLHQYSNGFKLTLQPGALELPLKWRQPRVIFVNSMSDLFHIEVPVIYIQRVFEVMKMCPQHTFQVLTKRPERVKDLRRKLAWPENVWMGTSVENSKYLGRVAQLIQVPAAVRFLSLEPLLGPLPGLKLKGIHWVIVGGESGPGARLMQREWVEQIQSRCDRENVPFFFKQWGGVNKAKSGRLLNGKTWDEMPSRNVCNSERLASGAQS